MNKHLKFHKTHNKSKIAEKKNTRKHICGKCSRENEGKLQYLIKNINKKRTLFKNQKRVPGCSILILFFRAFIYFIFPLTINMLHNIAASSKHP